MIRLLSVAIFSLIFSPYHFSNASQEFVVSIPDRSVIKTSSSNRRSLNANSIKVFSWNIQKGENHNWYKLFHSIANQSDIFAIQEYRDTESVDYSLSVRKQDDIVKGISYEVLFWGSTGLTNLSKVRSTSSYLLRTKIKENFKLETYKSSLMSIYPIQGSEKHLLFINVHLLNSVSVREYQYELRRISEYIKKWNGPVVVAGDFNSWTRREATVQSWKGESNLLEVGFTPDLRKSFGGKLKIDRIFYRDLKYKSSWSSKTKLSDHNPLGAEFTL